MAIVITSEKIKEEIVDKNGNILTIISYNPEDAKAYTKFSDMIEKIYKIQDKIKDISPKMKKIQGNNMNLEEIEKHRKLFSEMNEVLHYQENMLESIFEDFNFIFGEGTCNKIMKGSYDVNLLMPILKAVKPHFEKVRNKKVNAYMPKTNTEALDVME